MCRMLLKLFEVSRKRLGWKEEPAMFLLRKDTKGKELTVVKGSKQSLVSEIEPLCGLFEREHVGGVIC